MRDTEGRNVERAPLSVWASGGDGKRGGTMTCLFRSCIVVLESSISRILQDVNRGWEEGARGENPFVGSDVVYRARDS